MKKIKEDSQNLNKIAFKKVWVYAIIFCFILVLFNLDEGILVTVLSGLMGLFFYGGLAFLICRSYIKHEVSFKRFSKEVYIFGWVVGVLNPLFWLIMSLIYLVKDYGEPFISKKFHQRVYWWGLIIGILFIALLGFTLLGLILLIPSTY